MRKPRSEDASVRAARELLGVPADAGPAQLARAYRFQALRLHPDVSLAPDATERFRALEAAYHLVLDAASDALDAARGNAPTATTTPTATPTAAGTTAPTRDEHRDPTLLLGMPPARGVPLSTSGDRRRVAWLAAGPVRVRPPRRVDSRAAPPSPGEL